MLPAIPNTTGGTRWRSADFRGIHHILGAQAGDIRDLYGVTPEDYPVLRTVDWSKRKYDAQDKGKYGSIQYGTAENERLYVVRYGEDALDIYDARGDVMMLDCTLESSAQMVMQSIALFNNFALFFPLKAWVRTDIKAFVDSLSGITDPVPYGAVYCVSGECYANLGGEYDPVWEDIGPAAGYMESIVGMTVTFTDGTYAGETAEANTIKATDSSFDWADYFSVGDAVAISGAADAENNKTLIVREIEGDELRFYEFSFTDTTTAESVTISRTVPDMDYVCVNENRVWGCKGKHLYASKLGDFKNWNVFDGLSTDSYSVDVIESGDFTGCISFMGYPVFMKRNYIYKVYGNKPSNYEVMGSSNTGTVNGDTLAIASDVLYYLSSRGIMAYTGGIPQLISTDLGDLITGAENAFGATDGRVYYFGYKNGTVYEYDPEKKMWHKQVYAGNISYGYRGHKGAVFVTSAGYRYGDITASGSMNNAFMVEFAEIDMGVFASKYPTRLWLRMMSANAVTVTVKYNGGIFETAFTVPAAGKSAVNFPVPIRRCDRFAIKLTGTGKLELYALEMELRAEQTNRKGG